MYKKFLVSMLLTLALAGCGQPSSDKQGDQMDTALPVQDQVTNPAPVNGVDQPATDNAAPVDATKTPTPTTPTPAPTDSSQPAGMTPPTTPPDAATITPPTPPKPGAINDVNSK